MIQAQRSKKLSMPLDLGMLGNNGGHMNGGVDTLPRIPKPFA